MEFGKLEDFAAVDFTLPKEDSRNTLFLAKYAKKKVPEVYVGCTGWAMPQWVGHVYPPTAKSTHFLQYYAAQFNTIELNTTHYRIPDGATIQKWRTESASDFLFCPKLPQSISHEKSLGLTSDHIRLFCESVVGLEEKLGCCFMQLPPHIGVERIALLERFFQDWDKKIPLAVEVRQATLFAEIQQFNTFFDLLEKYQITSVITDVAGRRDVLHQRLTSDTAMIRFIGNDLHLTDYQRVDEWVLRISEWFEKGLQRLYFFAHEPDNLQSPELAAYFIEKINVALGINVKKPHFFKTTTPSQMSLF